MQQPSELHTGLTAPVQALNDQVTALIDAGKTEEARALYDRGQKLVEEMGVGARLRSAAAPSVIITPSETERRIITPAEAEQLFGERFF